MNSFAVSKAQIEKVTKCLVKAIVTGNVAFSFVENPHLVEALTTLGVPPITRKQLADKWVPALAAEASVATAQTLAQAELIDASSDGWRKKYCEQGAALNNVVALLPDRALFHDALNCSSMRKDADAIARFLKASAASLVGVEEGSEDRLVGWVLDNTKSNWRAMLTLQEQYPKWIMRGCFAHGTALLMKDFCKYKTATGRGAATRVFGMKWAEDCIEKANKIANFLQDSGPARQLVSSNLIIHWHQLSDLS